MYVHPSVQRLDVRGLRRTVLRLGLRYSLTTTDYNVGGTIGLVNEGI